MLFPCSWLIAVLLQVWQETPGALTWARHSYNTFEVSALLADLRNKREIDMNDIYHHIKDGIFPDGLTHTTGTSYTLLDSLCDACPNTDPTFTKEELGVLAALLDAGCPPVNRSTAAPPCP